MLRAFLLTIGLLLSPMVAHAQRCAEPLQTGAGVSSTALNPVTVRVLGATIVLVPATDGLVHLAYAAQVTNLANEPATVEAIEPVNALRDFAPTGRNEVLAPWSAPGEPGATSEPCRALPVRAAHAGHWVAHVNASLCLLKKPSWVCRDRPRIEQLRADGGSVVASRAAKRASSPLP